MGPVSFFYGWSTENGNANLNFLFPFGFWGSDIIVVDTEQKLGSSLSLILRNSLQWETERDFHFRGITRHAFPSVIGLPHSPCLSIWGCACLLALLLLPYPRVGSSRCFFSFSVALHSLLWADYLGTLNSVPPSQAHSRSWLRRVSTLCLGSRSLSLSLSTDLPGGFQLKSSEVRFDGHYFICLQFFGSCSSLIPLRSTGYGPSLDPSFFPSFDIIPSIGMQVKLKIHNLYV